MSDNYTCGRLTMVGTSSYRIYVAVEAV